MARSLPQQDAFPLDEHLKTLADDELLDIWEETQYLDRFFEEHTGVVESGRSMEYERLILQELQIRSCRKSALPR